MRLRQLRINVGTSDGLYGTTLNFPDGLVVIRAENSMGKSTCARSILVALGMEAMLTTSQQDLPLTPAMVKLEGVTGPHTVLESEIWLEIENDSGKRVTVQRAVKGQRDKNLITVFMGPALTAPGHYPTRDYFVNRGGGATREAGFHHFLSSFLGWELPKVQRYDGSEVLLYLQCLLPFFMTEQTRGWSSILPPVPTQFQIRDVHKRAVEFLLGMDAHKVALARQELQLQRIRLESRWSAQVRQLKDLATAAGGVVHSGPATPTSTWPQQVPPSIIVPREKQWISLSERVRALTEKKAELDRQEVPSTASTIVAVREELAQAESEIANQQAVLTRMVDALASEEQEVLRVEHRLAAIKDDIKKNQDSRTLRKLGSRKDSAVDQGSCPVCHQSVADSLIPLGAHQQVMTLDESIDFMQEQGRIFQGVLEQSRRVANARQLQVTAARTAISGLRERVQQLRQTLTSDSRGPSLAAVYERVEVERGLKQDSQRLLAFAQATAAFDDLAKDWRVVETALAELPDDDLSADDRAKLVCWEDAIRNQLRDYGFRSLSVGELVVSPHTYRPEIEGFELQTTISASDLIRTIWAYQNGMLEVARDVATNHPGMLLLDEPRQQSSSDVSFVQLLRRVSSASTFGQQVILFTSEERERLDRHLTGLPHSLQRIEGRVLQKVQ